MRFLFFSAWLAYVVQLALVLVLPTSVVVRVLPSGYWFGMLPAVDAIAVAWALSFKDQTVRLMFVLPVTGRAMLIFVGAVNVLYLLAARAAPSGLLAPFGGMFAGWLLGGGSPSPLRRAYLKLRLAQLGGQSRKVDATRAKRIQGSGLRVIRGGQDGDDKGGSSNGGSDSGRWLN